MTTIDYKTLLDNTIENNDLYGRSFTYGVALYKLISGGYFALDDDETLTDTLTDIVAAELDTTAERVSEVMTLRALAETVDVSVLDELARELAGEEV